jgi:nucleoside-diphosphate kinase
VSEITERTFVMLKPDTVKRKLIGEIIHRIEQKGFNIVAMKMTTASRELAEKHYDVHRERDFFKPNCDFVCSGPVVAMIIEGNNAIYLMRTMIGETHPTKAQPGTIRGDLTTDLQQNLIHGSDCKDSADTEIALWFPELFTT